MICKFHAFMNSTPHPCQRPTLRLLWAVLLGGALACGGWVPVRAERADRFKQATIVADQGGQIDLQKQVVVFSGNVVVTKGTMVIRASRIEVRQTPDGYDMAVAFGQPGKPATFRQKRDNVDEYLDGEAEKLEYDGKADVVRFLNSAVLRRLRGATPADEITGNLITYDATTDQLTVSGSAATVANPSGRVRAVLAPREGSEAASEAAAAALPLKRSMSLGASQPGEAR